MMPLDFAPASSIRCRGLSLWYGAFQALTATDLDVRDRSITALIGPSGCGKTTLLRCINRLNERHPGVRTSGEVRIFGRNIYDPDVSLGELRKSVGMVFQRPNPLPLSIEDNVTFGLDVHLLRRSLGRRRLNEAVEQALTDVQLWEDVKDQRHRPALSLSLEQQQKLCIARGDGQPRPDHGRRRRVPGRRRRRRRDRTGQEGRAAPRCEPGGSGR
jgi:phosphate transport system ATP-binding protein